MSRRLFRSAIVVGALTLVVAPEALAHRFKFLAEVGETALSGAEVCFYFGESSANPVEAFAPSSRVKCLSADVVHHMRPGVWNYYLQHPSGYVSAYPDKMTLEGDNPDPEPRELPVPLRKAGTLDFAGIMGNLAEGEFYAVYISNVKTAAALGTIRPLPYGQTRMLVPADEQLVPLVVNHGRLVRVGAVCEVRPDASLEVRAFPSPKPGTADLVSWIKIDYSMLDHVLQPASLSAPAVELTTEKGLVLRPILPLRAGTANEIALQIFKDVPLGRSTVTLHGDRWESQTLEVLLEAGPAVMTKEPLMAVPAGRISATWVLPQAPSDLPSAGFSCQEPTSTPVVRLSVFTCPGLTPKQPSETIALTSCRSVAGWNLSGEAARGEKAVGGLSSRTYLVALQLPGMNPLLEAVHVGPGENVSVAMEPTFGSIFGRLTQGGVPLQAEIQFSTGTTLSDRVTGEYTLLTLESPGGDPITVKPCDGAPVVDHQPASPIRLNTAYDIALENTSIHTTVREKKSGEPIQDARVDYSVYREKKADSIYWSGTAAPTKEDGRATFRSLPSGLSMFVCARKQGFDDNCTDRFELRKDESRDFTIELEAVHTFAGRIVGAPPLENGLLFWTTRTGHVTEMVEVAKDGQFLYRSVHGDTEAAILISANAPLHVFNGKATGESALAFQVAQLPIRTFSVSVAPGGQDNAYVGLWIGGIPIPSEVFERHQTARGMRTMIIRREPIVIRHIVETGPIEITLGPQPQMVPKDLPDDWFAIPTYAAAFPKKALGLASNLEF